MRYTTCMGNYLSGRRATDPLDRFAARIERDQEIGCWLWIGRLTKGYGRFEVDERNFLPHRWIYQQLRGPIPDGLVIDHLCEVTRCVNPRHCRPDTSRANTLYGSNPAARHARQKACSKGHPFTKENTRTRIRGGRECRTCRREALVLVRTNARATGRCVWCTGAAVVGRSLCADHLEVARTRAADSRLVKTRSV